MPDGHIRGDVFSITLKDSLTCRLKEQGINPPTVVDDPLFHCATTAQRKPQQSRDYL